MSEGVSPHHEGEALHILYLGSVCCLQNSKSLEATIITVEDLGHLKRKQESVLLCVRVCVEC